MNGINFLFIFIIFKNKQFNLKEIFFPLPIEHVNILVFSHLTSEKVSY